MGRLFLGYPASGQMWRILCEKNSDLKVLHFFGETDPGAMELVEIELHFAFYSFYQSQGIRV